MWHEFEHKDLSRASGKQGWFAAELRREKARLEIMQKDLRELECQRTSDMALIEDLRAKVARAQRIQDTADRALDHRRLVQDDVATYRRELSAARKTVKGLESQLMAAKADAAGEEERTRAAVDAALRDKTAELEAAAARDLAVAGEHFAHELLKAKEAALAQEQTLNGVIEKLLEEISSLKKFKPPPAAPEWASSTADAVKSRSYRDKVYLRAVFEEREFVLSDLAYVLDEQGYLYHLFFNSQEGWRHLMYFLRYHEDFGIENTWHSIWERYFHNLDPDNHGKSIRVLWRKRG